MRTCENSTCLNPADWREKTARFSAANPHNNAYCEPCRIELGIPEDGLVQLRPAQPALQPEARA